MSTNDFLPVFLFFSCSFVVVVVVVFVLFCWGVKPEVVLFSLFFVKPEVVLRSFLQWNLDITNLYKTKTSL